MTTIIKSLLILSLFASIALADISNAQQQLYNQFKTWTNSNSKKYGVDETPIRFANWQNNYNVVQDHNAQGLSWELEMNQFADMTPEEFAALHLGYNGGSAQSAISSANSNTNAEAELLTTTTLNSSVDWRNSSAVTAIKNQGSCGSCWSFSTTGALEGLNAIKNKKLLSFSEQQLVDCSSSYGNEGCNGGMYTGAFQYVEKEGIELESSYAYTGTQATCKYSSSKAVFKNTGYKSVTTNNATLLKAAVAQQPVSVAIEADQQVFQLYKSGVLSSSCGTSLDHAVLVIGYNTLNGVDYWIVKNSWGTSWGLSGYVYIAAGQQNSGAGVCGINSQPAYPTL